MNRPLSFPARAWRILVAASLLALAAAGAQAQTMAVRPLADGLRHPFGVAVNPVNGHVYAAETDSGRILDLSAGKAEALPSGWKVSEELPRWAVSEQMPRDKWLAASLEKPGPIAISANGTLYVAEQVPNGRILEFVPDDNGAWTTAHAIPVPWLEQEFQWRAVQVDSGNRLFVAGTDEIGNSLMKFGSALMRDAEGDWWVLDHGPFAQFNCFAMSQKEEFMLLGDMRNGALTWWELNKHLMLGGTPSTTTRGQTLQALAIHPDGAFILGIQTENGASILRLDPFTQQQITLSSDFRSLGVIVPDRANSRFLVSDPSAGRVCECTFTPPLQFTENAVVQIVRSAAGSAGFAGGAEAPAFLNSFIERLQSVFEEDFSENTSHAVAFNISDIVGKLPIIAGRIQALLEVENVEEDPLETVEFFLLFPSRFVMTDSTITPSLSFFSARRKSGKLEQTKPVFTGGTSAYRLSGTNVTRIANSDTGLHVPVVSCGLDEADGGIYVHLAFFGMGIYSDYMVDLFQGPAEQHAKIIVPSPSEESGVFTYDASFMQDVEVQGTKGSIQKETISNLLIAGFESGSGGNRSFGWLRLGRIPASMMVGFGDTFSETTGGQADIQDLLERKRIEMSMESATSAEEVTDEGETNAPPADESEPDAEPEAAP